ncbi:MAG: DnaJ domain-containing protein [Gammaproteobacteria bacterium]|nr:DnaJ domain-containing protein [Gammaproteobacteria bacterium]
MLIKLIVFLFTLIILVFIVQWFTHTPAKTISRTIKRAGLIIAGLLLIVLVLTGKLPWLFALLGGALPFFQRIAALLRGYQMFKSIRSQFSGAGTGRNPQASDNDSPCSQIETRFLKMSLNHDTGNLEGLILDGVHAGIKLSELKQNQLISLLKIYRIEDPESATLLESFVDRHFGAEWRSQQEDEDTHGVNSSASEGKMTHEEACQILGIAKNADQNAIKTAHRKLMQKFHPDRGGSTYLAAKINKAKDVLLASL